MDMDEERDFAEQGPLTDMDMKEDAENAILENNHVPSHSDKKRAAWLRTFGCIQWECELYSGRPNERCYPFNLKGHLFWRKNRQVLYML